MFRKGYSCVKRLILMCVKMDRRYWITKNNTDDIIIYLDLQKAFDKVPHKSLITKLKGYEIQVDILRWIEDFLKDRNREYKKVAHYQTGQILHV